MQSVAALQFYKSLLANLMAWAVAFVLGADLSQEVSAQDADKSSSAIAWRLEDGDEFQVKVTQSSNRKSQLDSRITVIESKVDLDFDWRVTAVADDGLATIEQVLKRFSVNVVDPAVPGQAVQYASDADQSQLSSAMRKLLRKSKPLIGLKCEFQMLPNGKIESVQLSESAKSTLAKLPVTSKLRTLFSGDSLEKTLSQVSLVLPADAKPGKQWKSQDATDTAFGNVELVHSYEIGTPDARGLVEVVSQVKRQTENGGDDADDEQAANESQLNLLSLAGGGSMSFDVQDGYFKSSQSQRTVSTSRKYREKTILTTVKSETQFKIQKK